MDITAQTIEKIESLVKGATAITLQKIPDDPLGRTVFVKPDKTIDILTPPPGYHREQILTVGDLVQFTEEVVNRGPDGAAVAYVSPEGITVLYDQADQRSRVHLRFNATPAYAWLTSIPKGESYSQRDLIRLLRVQLAGCLPAESNLLNLVRNIKWQGDGEVASNIQHGNESIGKSIRAQVSGEGAFPETFRLFLPLFEEFAPPSAVEVYLEPQPSERTFFIRPFPKSLADARAETLASIRDQFTDHSITAFLGYPIAK